MKPKNQDNCAYGLDKKIKIPNFASMKKYKMPAIVWLKMTDYMHGWLEYELGGALRARGKRVLSVQHLDGAREIFTMMESVEETFDPKPVKKSMSAMLRNIIECGLNLDEDVTKEMYGLSKEDLQLFVPVECPRNCLTKNGVLRPWELYVGLSKKQASEMQNLLRREFWWAVEEFNMNYAVKMRGEDYYAVDMIEEFCAKTHTSELHIDTIRREWQRRCKRGDVKIDTEKLEKLRTSDVVTL